MKPKIGIIPGDPSGIGPELIARLLTSDGVAEAADILLIGDAHVFEAGQVVAETSYDLTPVDTSGSWPLCEGFAFHAMKTIAPEDVKTAEVTKAGGVSVLATLDQALAFVQDGVMPSVFMKSTNALWRRRLGYVM